MGHSACGAAKGACEGAAPLGSLTGLLQKLQPSIQLVREESEREAGGFCDRVAEKNVELVAREIREKSPVLDEMITSGEVGLVGAFYSVSSAEVQFHELFCGTPSRQEVASEVG